MSAARLVQQYGSVQELQAHLEDLKGRLRENVAASSDRLALNKDLARIVTDLELPIEPEDCVMGDWDAFGGETAGVFRRGVWFMRNYNSTGPGQWSFAFGNPVDVPVAGDWNGDGADSVGVYRDGTWYLRNSSGSGPGEIQFAFGNPGDLPVVAVLR